MIWSNWQGAIWRGAIVVVLFWSGLAWTQTSAPRSPNEGGDRIMVVHENGKATRCRVVESWQLPDGRLAHLLQALETGEMITIVDDRASEPGPKGIKGMPKRIFAWGLGQRTPPKDAPIPPQLRHDSGIVIRNEAPAPHGAVQAGGPLIVNRVIDEKALGGTIRPEGKAAIINQAPVEIKNSPPQAGAVGSGLQLASGQNTGPNDRSIQNASGVANPAGAPEIKNAQMLEFPNEPSIGSKVIPVGGQSPRMDIVNEQPRVAVETPLKPGVLSTPPLTNQGAATPALPDVRATPVAVDPIVSKPIVQPAPGAPIVRPTPIEVINAKPVTPGIAPAPIEVISSKPVTPAIAPAPIEVINSKPILPANPTLPEVRPSPVALDPVAPRTMTPREARPSAVALDPKPASLPNVTLPGIQSTPILPLAANPPVVGGQPAPAEVLPLINPNVATPPLAGPLVDPTSTPTSPLAADLGKKGPSKAADTKKPWRPGEVLFGWMKKDAANTTKPETPKIEAPRKGFDSSDLLTQQNKAAEKNIASRVDKLSKGPFSTAMAQPEAKKPEASPLAISGGQKPKEQPKELPKEQPKEQPKAEPLGAGPRPLSPAPLGPPPLGGLQQAGAASDAEKRDMWGTGPAKVESPGKSLLDPTALKADAVKLPAPPARSNDPLTSPERYIPNDDRVKPKASMLAPVANLTPAPIDTKPAPLAAAPVPIPTRSLPAPVQPAALPHSPLGSQSVLAAHSGLQGPVQYIPVPLMTAPQPNHPPGPPPPQMPEAPQLNAYLNAFTPPAQPKAAPQQGASQIPQWMQPNANVMMQQQMMQQQALMQQQILQQQMIQQQMMQHQAMLAQAYRPNAYPPNPYASYGNPAPSQGPMSNMARHYTGPMPPTPYSPSPVMPAAYMPTNYPPMAPMHAMMPPQQPVVQQASYQPMPMQANPGAAQVEHLIKVMRESPYPAQREWAAQSLMSFEWRANPQVVPALLSSANQDPAASVRAGCVNCLGRMGAAVEPVFGVLHGMRNDIDPRVRQEVEQAFVRLGQSPMLPQ